MAESVVAMTAHERDKLEFEYGVDKRKLFVAGVGADLNETLKDMTDDKVVLFLGRKTKNKGIYKLLDAMTMVWNKHPDARLVLAGPESTNSYLLKEKILEQYFMDIATKFLKMQKN